MNRQRSISAIAWDLDNTLFDRDAAFRRFFEVWLTEQRPALDPAEQEKALSRIAAADSSGETGRIEFCRTVLESLQIPKIQPEDLWADIQERLPSFIHPDLRVLSLLETLSMSFELIVVSNGGSKFQRAKVNRSGIARFFRPERILVSGDIGIRKPDHGIFDVCIDRLGCDPGEVLFVGDHLVNDIEGAANAGMRTCWVTRGRVTPREIRTDLVVSHAAELKSSYIKSLASPIAA
ncbi:MAG: HAD family hydrolase [Verrucomicrobiaceae bacterium]|nr:MAG: HAD family hydrolase [Verrucomicrobiaceae bacterium]